MQNPWVFDKNVKNSWIFTIFLNQKYTLTNKLCETPKNFVKLNEFLHFCQKLMDFHYFKIYIVQNWNWIFKFNANAFPKNQNAFPKSMETHFQNPWKRISKNWKCICKIHENTFAKSTIFFWICNFSNAFPKSKVENAFFSRV